MRLTLELFQEPDIVLVKKSHVVDLVLEQRNTLEAHTKGKSLVFIGIDTAHLENMGMNLTATEDLDPTLALAETATLAVAIKAGYIHLSRRLRKGEVMGSKLDLYVLTKHLLCKLRQRTLKIRKGDILIDGHTLHLMEGR